MSAVKKPSNTARKLMQRDIAPFSSRGLVHHVTVAPEVTIDEILDPVFWTHVAGATFRGVYNEVIVEWEDKSAMARLYVRQYDSSFAKMELLEHHQFDNGSLIPISEKYNIQWMGPFAKYRVVRKEDGQVMRENILSKKDAQDFIDELSK
jgi:hypothetical protein